MSNVFDWAAQLLLSRRCHEPLHTNPQSGPASVEDAYAVQAAVWHELAGVQHASPPQVSLPQASPPHATLPSSITQHRSPQYPSTCLPSPRPSAWKVGAPSRDSLPLVAPILPQHLVFGVAQFDSSNFFRLGVEAEIAFCFGRNLPVREAPYSIAEIRGAIESAHVAMELVDTRLADAEASGPLWRLADNLLNGGLVIGAPIANALALEACDWQALTARVYCNGRMLAESVGRPPLDDLFHCLPWWINHVGGVKAGDIVTTGAWNGMHALPLSVDVRVEFSGLAWGETTYFAEARVSD